MAGSFGREDSEPHEPLNTIKQCIFQVHPAASTFFADSRKRELKALYPNTWMVRRAERHSAMYKFHVNVPLEMTFLGMDLLS